jgi:nucleoside-diphosphate-sugar epimerase
VSRRALVTGITGFIGGVVARRLLAAGWQVDALVRAHSDVAALGLDGQATFHTVADGQDLSAVLAQARPDVVLHLASLYLTEHRPDQIDALVASNVAFPARLAEAMVATGCTRLVNASTSWQRFRSRPYLPVNLYAATKQAAEDLLLFYADARGLSVTNLRLLDTFGAGDTRRKLIRILIDAARSGEALAMSPGEQIVDLTHVDDVADAFRMAAERLLAGDGGGFEQFYVSGERRTVREMAAIVADTLGRPLAAQFGGRPYRAREVMEPYLPGPDERLPGWAPVRTLAGWLRDLRD